jgi:N-terminal domain of anti-restriction factor ArdC
MATTTRRRRLTDEERAERREQQRRLLDSAVRELLTSEGWERWVRTRATFHRYSWRNTMLIATQRPDATRVAGFRAWLKLNRCVRKGEKGIRIFAPMTVPDRGDDGAVVADEHGQPKRRTLFRLTTVFDVSQTDPLPGAEPVPLDPPSQPLTGDSHADLIEPLTELAAELGYRVERRDLSGESAGGWCDPKAKLIVVGIAEPNAEVRTLIHELAHALVAESDEEFAYAYEEVIVESATYVAASAAGLDTSGESIPYVAGWGGNGALEAIQQVAELIDRVALRLEKTITRETTHSENDQERQIAA